MCVCLYIYICSVQDKNIDVSYFLIVRDDMVKLLCRGKSLISWYVRLIYPKQQTLKCFNHKQMVISQFNYKAEYKDCFGMLIAFLPSQLIFLFFF